MVRVLFENIFRLPYGRTVLSPSSCWKFKTADYIIDLGPEGGKGGGTIVATGTPEEVSMVEKSYTGYYLNKVLNDNK